VGWAETRLGLLIRGSHHHGNRIRLESVRKKTLDRFSKSDNTPQAAPGLLRYEYYWFPIDETSKDSDMIKTRLEARKRWGQQVLSPKTDGLIPKAILLGTSGAIPAQSDVSKNTKL